MDDSLKTPKNKLNGINWSYSKHTAVMILTKKIIIRLGYPLSRFFNKVQTKKQMNKKKAEFRSGPAQLNLD